MITDGLKQYKDGSWGVLLAVPARLSASGRRSMHRKKIGTKKEARNYRDQILVAWREGRPLHLINSTRPSTENCDSVKIGDWLEAWKSIRNKRDHSLADLVAKLFGNVAMESLKLEHIYQYVDKLKRTKAKRSGKPLSNETIKNRLQPLRGAYRLAREAGAIPLHCNPFQGFELRLSRQDNTRHVYLSKTEEDRVIEEIHPHYAALVRFAILTGMRAGELISLKWDQVKWKNSQIHLVKTKNGRQRFVPLSSEAIDILHKQKSYSKTFVFTSHTGGQIKETTFHSKWRPAFNRAGLEHARWHDLRHTCASRMVQAGVPLYTVGQVLGHSSHTVTQRYAHLAPDHLVDAVEMID